VRGRFRGGFAIAAAQDDPNCRRATSARPDSSTFVLGRP
jgi:hypothetical protein